MTRLLAIETTLSDQAKTYASAVKSISNTSPSGIVDGDRLDKLEYQASEEERKKRLNQALVTHSSLDTSAADLVAQAKTFCSQTLKMEQRSIDAQLQVHKCNRENTLMFVFSAVRFKRFLYAARKKLREQANPPIIYINDNLTTLNFNLIMKLKRERAARRDGPAKFESVYSFDGRIYAKIRHSSPKTEAHHIKNKDKMDEFLSILNNNSSH